jgi:precorrin-6A/cobalt-precorrin-6A reductase
MPAICKRILILGGTGEAATLARTARERMGSRAEIIYSLAGRLASSPSSGGAHRVGGFGGAHGLQRYLQSERIDVVIDATHPFATRIADHAATACSAAGVARLMLKRPAWHPTEEDRWFEVETAKDAAAIVSGLGRRVFLTTGRGTLETFGDQPNIWFLVRLIEEPRTPLPLLRYDIVFARPPFSVESERRLMQDHRVDVLVTKNSGGVTEAKLIAARQLKIPIVVIRRPAPPPGTIVTSVDSALAWLETTIEAASEACR